VLPEKREKKGKGVPRLLSGVIRKAKGAGSISNSSGRREGEIRLKKGERYIR